MNRIILLVLFVFSYCVGTSQSISQRSQPVITVQDGRLFAQYNFRPPVFADTIQANLQIGLDSCGALIFSRDINSYYLRACSPKRWVAISGGSSIDTTSLSNRINLKIDSLKRSTDSVFAYRNGTRVFQFKDSLGTTPGLQQVTDVGNITTNDIKANSYYFFNPAGDDYGRLNYNDFSWNFIDADGIQRAVIVEGAIALKNKVSGFQFSISGNNLTANKGYQMPNYSTGTTQVLPTSVNGNYADASGNITISTGDVAVDTIFRTLGKDSIFYKKNNITYAIKDSVGAGASSDTAKVVIAQVHNATATTLLRGEVVYLFGATGDVASVKRANNKNDTTSSKTFGVVRENIISNGNGFITIIGQVSKLNLGAYNEGDVLWLDSLDGQFTNVKPQAPYHAVFIGIVERANNGNGLAYIKPQNGVELDEVHDVQINSILNNQILVYSDTQKVWKNRNLYSVVDTINTIATKSNVALKLNSTDTASLSNRINEKQTNLDLLQLMFFSIKAEPYGVSLANMSNQLSLVTNRLFLYPFNWNISDTLKNISFFNRAAFTNTATNYNGVAIYSLSGGTLTRIMFTPNDGTFWNSTINSWSSKSVPATYLTKGIYFIGYQFSGSGTPTMGSGAPLVIASTQSPSEPPSGVNTNGIKFSTFIANATATPPSSIAMSATTAVVNVPYFMFY